MTIHGVDVSAYQPEAYSTAGLDFVIIKATEGLSYTNPLLAGQTKRARDAGLVVGFYHYPHMANDPKAEADYFLSRAPIRTGDLVVFDWEGYDSANASVPKARQVAYRDAWLKYVKGKLPGHRVGMYCNTDYWLNVDKTSNCGDFLWIATGGKPAGQPGIKAKWLIHQYSTAGGVDHDVADFTDRAALKAWAAGTPQEDDVALTTDDINKVAAAVLAKLTDGNELITYLLTRDGVLKNPNPATNTANPFIAVGTSLNNSEIVGRRNDTNVQALQAAVSKLQVGGVDLDALATKVADLLAARLAN